MIKNFKNSKKGETLLEALIAISTLLIVLSYSATIFTGGLQTMTFSRDRAKAMFLAEEGIEGVKNIIGSNLLRLSADVNNCWNAGWKLDGDNKWAQIESPEDCTDVNNKIGNGALPAPGALPQSFRIFFDSNLDAGKSLFRLENYQQKLELKNTGCNSGVIPPCLSNNTRADNVYGLFEVNGRYEHVNSPSTDQKPIFYRSIEIEYFDNIPDGIAESNAMKVKSKVIWTQGGNFKSVEYVTILTRDYAS